MRTHTMTTAEAACMTRARPETGGRNQVLRNLSLFLAAPFIGLAYITLLPLTVAGALGRYPLAAAFRG